MCAAGRASLCRPRGPTLATHWGGRCNARAMHSSRPIARPASEWGPLLIEMVPILLAGPSLWGLKIGPQQAEVHLWRSQARKVAPFDHFQPAGRPAEAAREQLIARTVDSGRWREGHLGGSETLPDPSGLERVSLGTKSGCYLPKCTCWLGRRAGPK